MKSEFNKIEQQLNKTKDICNIVIAECGTLMTLIRPYLCEEWQEKGSIFEQSIDGLVLLIDDSNYSVDDIIEKIRSGKSNIGKNDISPF